MSLFIQNKYVLLLCQKTCDVLPDPHRAVSDHKLSSLRTSSLMVSTNIQRMSNNRWWSAVFLLKKEKNKPPN